MKKFSSYIAILGLLSVEPLYAGHKAKVFDKKEKDREAAAEADQKKEALPLSMKGVGIPGSPHQKENLQIPASQKQGPVKSETSHGHLIVIPRTPEPNAH